MALQKIEDSLKETLSYHNQINTSYNFQKCQEVSTDIRKEGNKLFHTKNHDKKTHMLILSLYSQSIAFAPNDTEELAKAYSNRSALLLHLKKYKECIVDIDKSLEITKSEQLKTNLLARKTQCLNLIRNSHVASEKLPQKNSNLLSKDDKISDDQKKLLDKFSIRKSVFLNSLGENINEKLEIPKIIRSSREIPCAAKCVSLSYSEKYGNHVTAKCDIKPGQIILVEESFNAFPGTYKLYLVCSYCLSYAWNGTPCDSCAFAIYCSEECKKKAMHEYHDIECKLVPFFYLIRGQDKLVSSHEATIRLFLKLFKTEGLEKMMNEAKILDRGSNKFFNDTFSCNKFWCCYNLTSHCSKIDDIHHKNNHEFSSLVVELLKKYTTVFSKGNNASESQKELISFTKNLLIRLKNTLEVNSYYFQDQSCTCIKDCDPSCQKRGIILAVCSSLMNHSCYPNVGTMFVEKQKLVQYTLRPIKKGEQLFTNYGTSMLMNVERRKSYLQKDYYFTCDCQPCSENWPLLDQIDWTYLSQTNSEALMLVIRNYVTYCAGDICPLLHSSPKWCYNEQTLVHVIKMLEIISKHFDNFSAFIASINYVTYIANYYTKAYGIECDIPNGC